MFFKKKKKIQNGYIARIKGYYLTKDSVTTDKSKALVLPNTKDFKPIVQKVAGIEFKSVQFTKVGDKK